MSEIEKETEYQQGYSFGRLRIMGWSDWHLAPGEHWNWFSAELLRVHFERAFYKETFEVNFALLGFNLCIEWYMGEDGP